VGTRVYVGTYSKRGSEGIYLFEADPNSGALTHISSAPAVNPSHLALSANGRFLFAVNELNEFQGQPFGAASAFEIDPATGGLSFLNQELVNSGPCHALVDPSGRWLVTANYTAGNHNILPIGEGGLLKGDLIMFQHGRQESKRPGLRRVPSGPTRPRRTSSRARASKSVQSTAKAHSSLFSSDGRFLFTCLLGLDLVAAHSFDSEKGYAVVCSIVKLSPGAGPRHQALHPTLPRLYVINELDSTVSALARDHQTGELDLVQTLPTLPPDFAGRNACADLHLSPDGRFLYGSNRGHNSLAVFAIKDDGLLNPIGHVSTGGEWPRGFGVLMNGLILVANERSDNIVAFRIGEDGIPIPTGAVTSVPCPVCVLPA
jgi:6-phosphogluconolactonase